jgi:hypothetical protein
MNIANCEQILIRYHNLSGRPTMISLIHLRTVHVEAVLKSPWHWLWRLLSCMMWNNMQTATSILTLYLHPYNGWQVPTEADDIKVVASLQVFWLKLCRHFSRFSCTLHYALTTWLHQPSNTPLRIQTIKLLIMLYSPISCQFFPTKSKLLNILFLNTITLYSSLDVDTNPKPT